jgi:hypothetical protein
MRHETFLSASEDLHGFTVYCFAVRLVEELQVIASLPFMKLTSVFMRVVQAGSSELRPFYQCHDMKHTGRSEEPSAVSERGYVTFLFIIILKAGRQSI